ncbi:iron ABC transporter permease [Rathayibacter sp. CAU 1779]
MVDTQTRAAVGVTTSAPPRRPPARLVAAAVVAVLVIAVLAAIEISQGTASVSVAQLWNAVIGQGTDAATAVLTSSRLPRLVAALLVGVTLGTAGAALQSVSRNVLASPDTLAVNAGAYLAVVAVAAFGVALPVLPTGAVAFAGGLLAAAVVLGLSRGGSGPIRLVLAGSALELALSGLSGMLLLLYAQQTTGLFAWGNGTLLLTAMNGILQMLPVAVVGVVGLLVMGRRLDILSLGDDSARIVGVAPGTTRAWAVVFAVLLSAVAVTVAGPIGFVGLCAPALARLIAPRVPGLARHRAFIPFSALAGVIIVLTADVLLRALFGGQAGTVVPTGVVTTVFGAIVLVILAYRVRDAGSTRDDAGLARLRSRRAFVVTIVVVAVAILGSLVAAVLLGDAKLLMGDVVNWLTGHADRLISFVLDTRVPRVVAALLAGAALAVAGTVVQAVSRNPLAEPGILGVSGGAGVGAIALITAVPLASFWLVGAAALAGAAIAAAIVFGLAARRGLEQNRLVLIGIGVSAGASALVSLLIVLTDPYNATKALTWLSGSTYGRTFPQLVPVLIALAIALPVLASMRRELDLIGLDADTPSLLGIDLVRTRLALLCVAVLLTAASVSAVGVIGFVGLVAPHAARGLVGRSHARVVPVAAMLGALLVCVADTVGRTVIAPGQIPVGLVTAVIGAPYLVWLLWRSRSEE